LFFQDSLIFAAKFLGVSQYLTLQELRAAIGMLEAIAVSGN
jgi:hypothetical protein